MFKKEKEMEKVAGVDKTREVEKPKEAEKPKEFERPKPKETGSPLANRSAAVSSKMPSKVDQSVIGDQISIEGTIRGEGDLLVEGTVKGNIEVDSHHLTIGLKGNVESKIQATDVTISGRLEGEVYAKGRVAITKEAFFSGKVHAKSISVEDGAHIKASIELIEESSKGTTPKETNPKETTPTVKPGFGDKSSTETGKETPTTPTAKTGEGN
ncbi:MAG: polymer-forming cytoskeletal protein [Candidatus Thiosymbion ectosymbiont of Robbea hypermnestra]|nr:polymer-forming cytoskeletal protein [Candidatus Thiosymbion ectosymbiont of Robbea hypermnestra]